MQLELHKNYHGFTLLQEKQITEINSLARVFEHEKSGAKLLQLENDDDNKVFSVSFRTPPEDNTGLPHILEHSVLCGSRKFPSKEPFVELIKGSLNTFLNAMTFPDKTMYPIASKNEKDFYNLMDVYMDAVFYPNIYKHKEILMQEGWHYELEDKSQEMTYKGVVYNEMKGAFSSPESVLMRKIQDTLFPDTPYGLESGGDPQYITDLTQKQFEEFHSKYYHPSNSYIFLYGDANVLDELKFINDNYLKDFNKIHVDSELPMQKPIGKGKEFEIEYPISEDEEISEKVYMGMNFVVGTAKDPELYLTMEILEHLLIGTSAAPLKKALIEAEIGKDVFGQMDNGILQPTFSVIVKNTELDKKEAFQKVIEDTLTKLVQEGIDKKLVEASINIKEFQLREAEFRGYPKGLIYNIKCLDSWLYDGAPFIHLEYEAALEKVKTALTTNYLEDIIAKYLLDNNHSSLLILKPKKGLSEERESKLKNKLAEYKKSLSDKELEHIIEQCNLLKERQNSPDSPEALESIPLLELSDINPKAEKLPLEIKEEKGVKLLTHPVFTNNIGYVQLFFDTTAVKQEQIQYIALLSDILGKISTEEYHYSELSKEININTGDIRFIIQVYGDKNEHQRYYPKLTVKAKALTEKLPRMFELIEEITSNTKLDEKKRLREIIREVKSRIEMRIMNEGHMTSAKRLLSYLSNQAKYIEHLTGVDYYKFLADMDKHFDNKADEVINNLREVYTAVFNKNNLMTSVTCSQEDYPRFLQSYEKYVAVLPESKLEKKSYSFDLSKQNEGLLTQSNVQYVAKGYNFVELGYKYSGTLQVLKSIARYDYLWNNIRVKGGAYGAMAGFERSGNLFFVSYRDPNLGETMKVYDGFEKYLNGFDVDNREMTKYIIGTMSGVDTPLTPSMKGERAAEYYIRNISYEDIQRERDEILKAKKEDIKALANIVGDAMKQNRYCVLGNEAKIKQSKELFDTLVNVLE
ncbi:MAG: peptidase [Clostridia bacterium]|nr:peptidase [Clostridia bacterium]